ncbi:MAG TPA: hypothetical protein VLT82_11735 [Myxococcaceae bacterium]|nr:hypothetical protein [Myxococcaceae bacterium]
MHSPMRCVLAVLLLAAGRAAAADAEPAASGFEAAFRSGVMFPAGDADKNEKLSDYAGLGFPIWGDIGYRFGGKFFVGATAFYAFGTLGDQYKNQCNAAGLSCSGSGLRLGAEAQFHPSGRAPIDPWVGLGFGFEWISTKISSGTQSGTVTLQGWDFLQLEGGVDFALGSLFRLGPFVAFSMGQYDTATASAQGQSFSQDIPNKALHYWFTVGAKLTVLP